MMIARLDRPSTIIDGLLTQAEQRPDKTALVWDGGALTWGEMSRLASGLSSVLSHRGISRGDHVGLLCSNRPAFLVLWFAIINRGAVIVSLNTGLVGNGLRHAVRQGDCKALIIEQALWDEKRSDLEAMSAALHIVLFDGEDDLFPLARSTSPDAVLDARGSDPCTIIYTSGTTGPPKGVVNCHRAYLACGEWSARALDLRDEDRFMVFLPLFHTNPQMYAVMSALTVGCSLAIRPKLSVSSFFDDARRFECTGFTFVGTVLAMLANRAGGVDRNHRLRFCIGGGAPGDVWRNVEDRFGFKVHELYGMTEIGGWVTANTVADSRFGSCGRPRSDVEVRVLDSADNPAPAGIRGEIVVRPNQPDLLLLGYYKDPAAAWAASRNFWFHTGDSGSFDEDGYLYFHGRLKETIRRGGESISPSEIETVLLDHPDVREAAVVGVPDPIFGEEIKAILVTGRDLSPDEISGFLIGRIAPYMLPRFVQFVTAIPKTETEKVRRHLLSDLEGETHDLSQRPS